MKTCTFCHQEKELTEFYRNGHSPSGYRGQCTTCINTKRRSGNSVERNRRDHLWTKYRITPEQYDAMHAEQSGVCAICDEACKSGRNLAVDHNHATKELRGLLCSRCNTAIGLLRERDDLLQRTSTYLNKYLNKEKPSSACQ